MKGFSFSILLLLVSMSMFGQEGGVPIDAEHFPDPFFRAWVAENFQPEDIPTVTKLRFIGTGSEFDKVYEINSIKGIEYFNSLEEVYFEGVYHLYEFDFSKNSKLKSFDSYDICIAQIDFSGCPELYSVVLWGYQGSRFPSLSFESNPKLKYLQIHGGSNLKLLDLSANRELTSVVIRKCDDLATLDLSNNAALETLLLHYSGLTAIDLSANLKLRKFELQDTKVESLDLSANTALVSADLSYNNQLTSVIFSSEVTLLGTDKTVDVSQLNYYSSPSAIIIDGSPLSGEALDNLVSSLPVVQNPTILRARGLPFDKSTLQKAVDKGWIVFFTGSDGKDYNTYDNKDYYITSVSPISVDKSPAALYDLQGRCLRGRPARGVYIQDGRKYLVK